MRPSYPVLFVFSRLGAALLAALLALALFHPAARAAERTFTIRGGDGYGVDDCLSSPRGCGKAIAQAWCSAQGLKRTVAFGSSADVTGSIPGAAQRQHQAMIITCAN